MFESAATLVCAAHGEERDIYEWLCYHTAIGFDRIVVYNIPFEGDLTNEVVEQAQMDLRSEIIFQPCAGRRDALSDAEALYRGDSEWLCFLDVNEFLVPAEHGSLRWLFQHIDPATKAIAIRSLCFGCSGHRDFPEEPVARAFTHRAPDALIGARHTKVLARNDPYSADPSPIAIETLRVNLYATRSLAHFRRQFPSKGDGEFDRLDRNEVLDETIPTKFGRFIHAKRPTFLL